MLPAPIVILRGEVDTASTSSAAVRWNDSYHENRVVFYQQHSAVATAAPTRRLPRRTDPRQVNDYADANELIQGDKVTLTGDDCARG